MNDKINDVITVRIMTAEGVIQNKTESGQRPGEILNDVGLKEIRPVK